LVTGANSGIGRGVAIALGQAGADVAVNYVSGDDEANAVVDQIHGFGVKAIAHKADVSMEDQVKGMLEHAIQAFGTLDILVNNAGLQRDAKFLSMTLPEWDTVLNVNLTGQFLCAREAIREFVRRGIVPSVIPWAGHLNYATSKGGIKMMMESLAQEVAPLRIRVNGIAPGYRPRRCLAGVGPIGLRGGHDVVRRRWYDSVPGVCDWRVRVGSPARLDSPACLDNVGDT